MPFTACFLYREQSGKWHIIYVINDMSFTTLLSVQRAECKWDIIYVIADQPLTNSS